MIFTQYSSIQIYSLISYSIISLNMERIESPPKIRPFLLWDIKIEKFDFTVNRQLVIERACSLGNLSDFKEIVRFYGLDIIKEVLIKSASLDPKSLTFFSQIFNIPLNKFKCYSKKASPSTLNIIYPSN